MKSFNTASAYLGGFFLIKKNSFKLAVLIVIVVLNGVSFVFPKFINLWLKKSGVYSFLMSRGNVPCLVFYKKQNMSLSPDGSKYPFVPGFGIKDIADSGGELDEKQNTSAPK
jgi:hypothetical protein